MNGGAGNRRRSFRSTETTFHIAPARASTSSFASPAFAIRSCLLSSRSPRILKSLARNGGGEPPSSRASSDQYSSGRNASISFSRSQISRTATDCTRPADSPRRTFFQSSGEIW